MNNHNYELWCKLDISTFHNNVMVLTIRPHILWMQIIKTDHLDNLDPWTTLTTINTWTIWSTWTTWKTWITWATWATQTTLTTLTTVTTLTTLTTWTYMTNLTKWAATLTIKRFIKKIDTEFALLTLSCFKSFLFMSRYYCQSHCWNNAQTPSMLFFLGWLC